MSPVGSRSVALTGGLVSIYNDLFQPGLGLAVPWSSKLGLVTINYRAMLAQSAVMRLHVVRLSVCL